MKDVNNTKKVYTCDEITVTLDVHKENYQNYETSTNGDVNRKCNSCLFTQMIYSISVE